MSLSGASVELTEQSTPTGFLSTTRFVETGTEFESSTASWESSGYRFTGWTLDGQRFADATGRAINPVTLVLYQPETLMAHYVPETEDADLDTLPDWQEFDFYGDLDESATSDTDLDGITFADELVHGNHPNLPDEMDAGGISFRMGSLATLILDFNFVPFHEVSSPPGIHALTEVVQIGTTIQLSDVPEVSNGYRFIGWYQGFFRLDSPFSLQPPYMNVSMETTFEARYLEELEDMDGDGIPDWYEQFHYTSLTRDASSDTDNDSIPLAREIIRGDLPTLADEHVEGGISFRASGLLEVNLSGLPSLTLTSSPAGFVSEVITAETGSLVTSPDLWDFSENGFRFAWWELDGTRQTDITGASAGQFSVILDTDRTGIAVFINELEDSDADGLLDWREYHYTGTLSADAASNPDLDAYDFATELLRGYHPSLFDEIIEGGVSFRASSGLLAVNLQVFDRLTHLSVDGVPEEVFSPDPTLVTGWSFSPPSVPALGDWDGDGDADLFVAAGDGLYVYENIGSPLAMNLSDRSSFFSTLSGNIAAMSSPRIAMGDWNNDGLADLAVGGDGGSIAFFRSTGLFTGAGTPSFILTTGDTYTIPAFGEFTGDTYTDLLVLLTDGTIRLYPNFTTLPEFRSTGPTDNLLGTAIPGATGLATADVNGDGYVDILISDTVGRIHEYHQLPNGTFQLNGKVFAGTFQGFAEDLTVDIGDVDGDGDPDVLAGSAAGGLTLLLNPEFGEAPQPPTDILLSSASVEENLPVGTVVGELSTIDPNTVDAFTYALVSGEGDDYNTYFSINGNELRTAVELDFPNDQYYSEYFVPIRIRSQDSSGKAIEKSLPIELIDVNEPPTDLLFNLQGYGFPHTPENLTGPIGHFQIVDPDYLSQFIYEYAFVSGDLDHSNLTISGNELYGELDYETQSFYQFRVRATDPSNGDSIERDFSFEVSDRLEFTGIGLATSQIRENDPECSVAIITTGDQDIAWGYRWEIVDGNGDTAGRVFTIGENGEPVLLWNEPFDFEEKSVYSVSLMGTGKDEYLSPFGFYPRTLEGTVQIQVIDQHEVAAIYSWLETELPTAPPESRHPFEDWNRDGSSNFMAYATGTWADTFSPRKSPIISRSGSNTSQLSLQLRGDDPHLLFKLGISEDLDAWTWHPLTYSLGEWHITGSDFGFVSAQDLGNGIFELILEDVSSLGRAFFSLDASYDIDLSAPAALVFIPPGEFLMGLPDGEPGSWAGDTQHAVELTRPYAMKRTPVTYEEWQIVRDWTLLPENISLGYLLPPGAMGATPASATGEHPVTRVNWYDVIQWCNAKSEMEGRTPVYYLDAAHTQVYRTGQLDLLNACVNWDADGYRLPTEAEWEHACRAGTSTSYFTGPITATGFDLCPNLDAAGWYGGNSGNNTHPVAQKAPNLWGLYDVHGNIWEWVWDRHEEFTTNPAIDPLGPDTGSDRLLRGGSYNNNAESCQASSRFPNAPGNSGAYGGFRIAVTIGIEN
jgi:formylglycine-generating enzyme required for sulfatase activity